jgi:hypothetical protein
MLGLVNGAWDRRAVSDILVLNGDTEYFVNFKYWRDYIGLETS